jgi:hypothetical protein
MAHINVLAPLLITITPAYLGNEAKLYIEALPSSIIDTLGVYFKGCF